MKSRWLALIALLLGTYATVPAIAAANEVERHCIGLLWCTERSADGTSVDGLLLLYSAEERGSYSRLAVRPLYSMEEDPTQNLLRRSILWPLGTYERRGDRGLGACLSFSTGTLKQPGREWTFTVPLYMKSIHGDSSWHHLFPLFSRHVMGEYYSQETLCSVPCWLQRATPAPTYLNGISLFPFFHYRQDLNSSNSWLFPFYWSGEDQSKGEAYRYILPLYGSSDDQSQRLPFSFPVLRLCG